MLLKEGEEQRPAASPSTDVGKPASPTGRSAVRDSYLGNAGGEGGSNLVRSAELERLREALRHKDEQLASLQDQLRGLEATRDRSESPLASKSTAHSFQPCFDLH